MAVEFAFAGVFVSKIEAKIVVMKIMIRENTPHPTMLLKRVFTDITYRNATQYGRIV